MKEECKKVYHFTTDAAWECMNKGVDIWLYDASKREYVDGMQVRGLWPMQRFLPDEYAVGLPAKAGDPVIEALLEPCPSGWTNNPEFPGYWNRLMRNILIHADSKDSRVLLLEARMQPCDDAWIVERAYAERVFSGQKTTTRFKKSEKEELLKVYKEHYEEYKLAANDIDEDFVDNLFYSLETQRNFLKICYCLYISITL